MTEAIGDIRTTKPDAPWPSLKFAERVTNQLACEVSKETGVSAETVKNTLLHVKYPVFQEQIL